VSYLRRTVRALGAGLIAAHLVERGPALLVHLRPPRGRVERNRLVNGHFSPLEGVAVVGDRAGRVELRLQLRGTRVGCGVRDGPLSPQRSIGCETSGCPGDPRKEALHAADPIAARATLAAASCLVIAPSIPERRQQSGPIQTMGSRREEVSGLVTTYEILLMLDPELAEERQDDLIARVRQLVETSGGTWRSHDAWGRRRLAYEIAKKQEGVYHLLVFEASGETLDEITRVLKIDDNVMRHLATRRPEGGPAEPLPVGAPASHDAVIDDLAEEDED
jgi:small subunit ribosomal protein S6